MTRRYTTAALIAALLLAPASQGQAGTVSMGSDQASAPPAGTAVIDGPIITEAGVAVTAPEPASIAILGVALLGLGLTLRRR